MSDGFRPREHDHLVEPMFAGLGVERAPEPPRPGFWARVRSFLRRFLGRASA